MSTYKVIQDIEAEDHILGPLTLRQFIFAIIAIVCFYFSYLVMAKGVPYLAAIFLPPGLVAGFFAFPFGKDQPTEIWALAKIRFLFKPRKRIWDQSGVKELVTVTAPKKVEEQRTNGLSQTEVRSRLSALANTLDSRGWAIKNVNVNMYNQPTVSPMGMSSDRLIDVGNIAREVPSYDIQASDDIMDAVNNPIAQQFDQLINASSREHRQQLVDMLRQNSQAATATSSGTPHPENYWFLNQSPVQPGAGQAMFADPSVVSPGDSGSGAVAQAAEPTAAEEELAERLKAEHDKPDVAFGHLKTLQPIGSQPAKAAATPAQTAQPTPQQRADTAMLARNDDLNIATLSRVANRQDKAQSGDNEVVITLH